MEMNFTPFSGTDARSVYNAPELQGFSPTGRASSRRVNEAARLYADVLAGREEPAMIREAMRPRHPAFTGYLMERYPGLYPAGGGRTMDLREAMAQTDYQALFGDVLDRIYYGTYAAWPIVEEALVKVVNLRDFRTVKRYLLDGMTAPMTFRDPAEQPQRRSLYGPIPQNAATIPLAQPSSATAPITYAPLLGTIGDAINWAAFVNDDLGIFKDTSDRLVIGANRGISKFIAGLFLDVNGPHASLYTSGYGNIINTANGADHTNPKLDIEGLSDGFTVLFNMKDSGGDPIVVTDSTIYLWYGGTNEVTANNLAHMISVYLTNRGGTAGTAQPQEFVQTSNWLISRVKPIYLPYLTTICSNNKGTWGLTVDPNKTMRPSVEVGYMNNFRTPQLLQKVPNTQRVGGGVDATLGDFYTMDQELKALSVIGGARLDGRTTVGSNGSGS